jgi:hypothetical protein
MTIRSSALSSASLLFVLSAPVMAQSPPAAAPAATAAPASTVAAFSLDPKHGQSAEQQAADRSSCQDWSARRSGYNPTLADGGVPADELASGRDAYRHAMTTCLEARGYRVSDLSGSASRAAKTSPLGCVNDTASRLPTPRWKCAGFGSTHTKDQLDSTGQPFAQDSLRMLDTAVTAHP